MVEADGTDVHDVVIAGPSAREELVSVVRTAAAVVFGVWLYLANQPTTLQPTDRAAQKNLLPYQAVVLDRPAEEQRLFRSLQVALLEAENVRASSGSWPSVEALTAEGIEPFAPDPTNRGARYAWRLHKDGHRIGYIGTPDRPDTIAWLLYVQEPDPVMPPEPFQNDEEHHKLADGLVLHVSTWTRPVSLGVPAELPRLPQGEGWSQLFAVGPSPTH